MKANAPDKIFISYETDEDGYIYTDYMWHRHQFEGVENIEYTRTDAFIEKACEWLKENFLFDEAGYCKTNIYSTESMIYNFKNTLGGKL